MTSNCQLYNQVQRLGKVKVFNALETNTVRPITQAQVSIDGGNIATASLATDSSTEVVINTGTVPNDGGFILRATNSTTAQWERYVSESNIPLKAGAVPGTYDVPLYDLDAEGRLANVSSAYTSWVSFNVDALTNVGIISQNNYYRIFNGTAEVQLNLRVNLTTGIGTSRTFSLDDFPLGVTTSGGLVALSRIALNPPNDIAGNFAQLDVAGDILTFSTSFDITTSSQTYDIVSQFTAIV